MTRVDVLMEALNKAIPSGGKSEYSVEKWRSIAVELDQALIDNEPETPPVNETTIRMTLASNDGLDPREMSQEIIKALKRVGSRA